MKEFKYAAPASCFARLWRPDNGLTLPVMVVVHGGYWKDNHSLDTYPTRQLVEHFAAAGGQVAVWDIEYRRMQFEGDNSAAPWPVVLRDVGAAIDLLREVAADRLLDLNRVMAIGHSAGGHLATWAAARKHIPPTSELFRPDPVSIHALVSIAGILDLSAPQALGQPDQVARMMGGTPREYPERYAAADPSLMATSLEIPQLIVQGGRDEAVPASQADAFRARSTNRRLDYLHWPEADHFSMFDKSGEWPLLVARLDAVLRDLMAGPTSSP